MKIQRTKTFKIILLKGGNYNEYTTNNCYFIRYNATCN